MDTGGYCDRSMFVCSVLELKEDMMEDRTKTRTHVYARFRHKEKEIEVCLLCWTLC